MGSPSKCLSRVPCNHSMSFVYETRTHLLEYYLYLLSYYVRSSLNPLKPFPSAKFDRSSTMLVLGLYCTSTGGIIPEAAALVTKKT